MSQQSLESVVSQSLMRLFESHEAQGISLSLMSLFESPVVS